MAHVRAINQNHPLPQALQGDKAAARLIARKAELKDKLAELTSSPVVDWDGVKLLKLEKLKVADQLEALSRTYH